MRSVQAWRGRGRAPAILLVGALTLVACAGDEVGDGVEEAAVAADDSSDDAGEAGTSAPEFEWQMAAFLGEATAQGQAMTWWMDQVEERSDGRITFERFFDASLFGPDEIGRALELDQIQVGNLTTAHTPGAFPVSQVAEIPFLGDNTPAQTATLNRMYEEQDAFREEWQSQGMHILSFIGIPPPITGVTEQIDSMSWFEGKSIRTVGYMTEVFEAIGADPVAILPGEIYEGMERGLVDGYTGMILDVIPALGLHEVGPHLVDMGTGFTASSTWAMSLEAWESLPGDLQEVVDEVTVEFEDVMFEYRNDLEDQACEEVLDSGGSITLIDDDEVVELEDLVQEQALDTWLAGLDGTGADGEQLYEDYVSAYEEQLASGAHDDYVQPMERCAELQDERS
jgi:TRAP-type transport system periplasmic protein